MIAGDVVRLACGGPKMVIERFDDQGNKAVCTHFVGSMEQRAAFEIGALKRAYPTEEMVVALAWSALMLFVGFVVGSRYFWFLGSP